MQVDRLSLRTVFSYSSFLRKKHRFNILTCKYYRVLAEVEIFVDIEAS